MCSSYFLSVRSFCVDQKFSSLIVGEKFLSLSFVSKTSQLSSLLQYPDLSLQHHGERTENCERYSGE